MASVPKASAAALRLPMAVARALGGPGALYITLAGSPELGATSADVHAVINAGLLDENPQAVFSGLARLLREDPLRWRRLGLLLEHMPLDLDADATDAVRGFVQALHDSLAAETTSTGR